MPIVLLAVAALVAAAPTATADPGRPPPDVLRLHSALPSADALANAVARSLAGVVGAGELLDELRHPGPDAGWLTRHLSRTRLSRKYGLIYKRHIDGLELRLRGPRLGGRKSRVGLSFELRF